MGVQMLAQRSRSTLIKENPHDQAGVSKLDSACFSTAWSGTGLQPVCRTGMAKPACSHSSRAQRRQGKFGTGQNARCYTQTGGAVPHRKFGSRQIACTPRMISHNSYGDKCARKSVNPGTFNAKFKITENRAHRDRNEWHSRIIDTPLTQTHFSSCHKPVFENSRTIARPCSTDEYSF